MPRLLCLIAVVSVWPFSAGAADVISQIDAMRAEVRSHRIEKVSDLFHPVRAAFAARGITRANARALDAKSLSGRLVRVSEDGEIHAYVYVTLPTELVVGPLADRGMRVERTDAKSGIVQGWIPQDALADVAALGFVTAIKPPHYAHTKIGSRMTAGDAILKGNLVRAQGFDGTGAKVGVISNGADTRTQAVASKDLPAGITVHGTCNVNYWGDCDEGTAMMEIIHDIAPGAQLFFGALSGTESTDVEFRNRLTDLHNDGVDIMVDDIGFFSEPIFEDGLVAQAVAAEVAAGKIYASAAGNGAEEYYEADFTGGLFSGQTFHNFGAAAGTGDDFLMSVTIAGGDISASSCSGPIRSGRRETTTISSCSTVPGRRYWISAPRFKTAMTIRSRAFATRPRMRRRRSRRTSPCKKSARVSIAVWRCSSTGRASRSISTKLRPEASAGMRP